MLLSKQECIHQVVDTQDVAHLPSVAIQDDGASFHCADQEVSDPALIFGPELVRAIDAAHSKHDRRDTVGARIVEHVLIRGSLGAAVGAVEIEGTVFADPGTPQRRVGWLVAEILSAESYILQGPVDLVSRGEHQRGRTALCSNGLQKVYRASCVYIKVFDRIG